MHVHACVCMCVCTCNVWCVRVYLYSACLHEPLEDWHVQDAAAALMRVGGGGVGGVPRARPSRDRVVCGVVQALGYSSTRERALEY